MADMRWFVVGAGWEQGPILWGAALMLSAIAWVLLLALAPRRSVALPLLASLATAVWLLGSAG